MFDKTQIRRDLNSGLDCFILQQTETPRTRGPPCTQRRWSRLRRWRRTCWWRPHSWGQRPSRKPRHLSKYQHKNVSKSRKWSFPLYVQFDYHDNDKPKIYNLNVFFTRTVAICKICLWPVFMNTSLVVHLKCGDFCPALVKRFG